MCVKLLDCTLRDGGYVIDWNFGEKNIQSVLANLKDANIDYIECGFLENCEQDKNKTFFKSPEELEKIIDNNFIYFLMINFGRYSIEYLPECKNKNIKLRVAFKKPQQKDVLPYIQQLVSLGWDVFVNPMSTNAYSETELATLIDEINKIQPYGLTIVDTLGNMHQSDVQEIFEFIDNRLSKNIALGFHSHNSLQLSFSNAKTLLKMEINREIVIDSCIYGMGRGAGNLCTELITAYLNNNYGANYELSPIIKALEENINPIYIQKPWGYSTPYYIAAIRGCHPNYASYLVTKGCSDVEIDEILSKISDDKKIVFDKSNIDCLICKC